MLRFTPRECSRAAWSAIWKKYSFPLSLSDEHLVHSKSLSSPSRASTSPSSRTAAAGGRSSSMSFTMAPVANEKTPTWPHPRPKYRYSVPRTGTVLPKA